MSGQHILLLTGIASPRQMVEDLKPQVKSITPMTFADHHSFKRKDIERLNETFEAMPSPKRIITTEKDAARLTCIEGLSDEVKKNLFVLPVRISFMLDQEDAFNQYITGYVRKNSRKNILMKGKSDHKPTSTPQNDGKPKTISFK